LKSQFDLPLREELQLLHERRGAAEIEAYLARKNGNIVKASDMLSFGGLGIPSRFRTCLSIGLPLC
jgi:hypothetical protein